MVTICPRSFHKTVETGILKSKFTAISVCAKLKKMQEYQ